MSSLPNEIFYNITNFIPNDDIADLMFMSRKFTALVRPRLQKINEEMTTMNQSIKSFMPSPAPEPTDHEWILQLNLKRFEPIGSIAKKRMKEAFEELENSKTSMGTAIFGKYQKRMSLERFNTRSFYRIMDALMATQTFRQEYNISYDKMCHSYISIKVI